MICDKFGAELKHRNYGNVFIFDINHLAKAGKIYGQTEGIQTRLILGADKSDAGDAGDALLGDMDHLSITMKRQLMLVSTSNSFVSEENKVQSNAKNELKESLPLRKSESLESPESPDALITKLANTKIKCPTCDHWETPFYMKIHQCPNVAEPESEIQSVKYNCGICIKNHKKRFQLLHSKIRRAYCIEASQRKTGGELRKEKDKDS